MPLRRPKLRARVRIAHPVGGNTVWTVIGLAPNTNLHTVYLQSARKMHMLLLCLGSRRLRHEAPLGARPLVLSIGRLVSHQRANGYTVRDPVYGR